MVKVKTPTNLHIQSSSVDRLQYKDPKGASNKPSNLAMDLILILLSALSLFSIFFFFAKSLLLCPENKKLMAPMAPGAWPLVGHLPFFENSKPTHVTFGDMAKVLGPVFMTKLGSYNVLIISSQEVAKECFTVHDKVIDRVDLTASKLLGYNGSFMTFTPYGPYWQELRKIAASELFSTTTIDKLKDTRAREVDVTFKDFYVRWEQEGRAKKGVLVDMKREFQDLAANISLMMIAGKRYFGASPNCEAGEARRCGKLVQEFFDYFGLYMLSDVIPSLGWTEWKIKKGMKRTAKELDKVVEAWVEEHKKRSRDHNASFEEDYLDLLIEIFEKTEIRSPSHDAHTTTKALCLVRPPLTKKLTCE